MLVARHPWVIGEVSDCLRESGPAWLVVLAAVSTAAREQCHDADALASPGDPERREQEAARRHQRLVELQRVRAAPPGAHGPRRLDVGAALLRRATAPDFRSIELHRSWWQAKHPWPSFKDSSALAMSLVPPQPQVETNFVARLRAPSVGMVATRRLAARLIRRPAFIRVEPVLVRAVASGPVDPESPGSPASPARRHRR
jgi:hypothetical protein